MTIEPKFINGRWRVVEDGNLVPGRYGTPVDGKGHETREKAQRQADAITAAVKKRKESQ